MRSTHVVLDRVDVAFDDERAVANAGLLLPATLVERLGLEQAADQLIDLGGRPGAARPGRKILTVVHSLVAGGTVSTMSRCCARAPAPACLAIG